MIGLPIPHERPSGRLQLNNPQLNIADTTDVLVLLDTISDNFVDGIENTGTHRITVGPGGFYIVQAQISYSQIIADKRYMAKVRKDGASDIALGEIYNSTPAGGSIIVPCSTGVVYLYAGDYLELFAYVSVGAATVDIGGYMPYAAHSFLALQRVR